MWRRTLPLLSSGVPSESQNSIRFPVPVCTLTMVSLMMRMSRGFSIPGHALYHSPVRSVSSLQRLLCQMIFQSSSFWS